MHSRPATVTQAAVWIAAWAAFVVAQPAPQQTPHSQPKVADTAAELRVLHEDASTMFHTYLMAEAQRLFDRRRSDLERDLADAGALRARQRRLRRTYRRLLGALPERTPLNPAVLGTLETDDYRIEKIAFESRPRFHVTANLYIPKKGPGPFPGILVPCGHSAEGKAADAYQSVCILLARNGFVVLVVDPICQGERAQILDRSTGGTMPHTLLDVGAKLVGSSTVAYEAWDNIRAIDYLQARPEVDPDRIGVTGNSGGGTQTTFLMALDDRVAVAAPSCYVMTREKLFATIGPQDGCQNLYAEVARGIEHADYITMRAPKPTLILAAEQDFFDFQGVKAAYAEAQRVYACLGRPQNVAMFAYDDTHGFSRPRRQAAVQWMRRWFYDDPAEITEPEPTLHTPEQLQVTATGRVRDHWPDERTVADYNRRRAESLVAKRRDFLRQPRDRVVAKIRDLVGYRPPAPAQARRVGTLTRDGYRIEKYRLEPADGIVLPALVFVPDDPPMAASGPSENTPHARRPAALWVDGRGKHTAAVPGGLIEQLVKQGRIVMALDVRGTGETADDPAKNRYAGNMHDEWRNAMISLHIARPLIGQRTADVITALNLLAARPDVDPRDLMVVGLERCGPVALHAALFDPRIRRVVVRESIRSWSDLVAHPLTRNSLSYLVPFALESYDLPDLDPLLAPCTVTRLDPLDLPDTPG